MHSPTKQHASTHRTTAHLHLEVKTGLSATSKGNKLVRDEVKVAANTKL